MTNIHPSPFAPATAMLQALREGQISASELLEMHLHRIQRHNPALNAIITPNYDHARLTAAAADADRARGGDARPLLGLPITLKDCIDAKGLPATAGVEQFKERYPQEDAPLVARLRATGAVIMGKTNVPRYLLDWQSANPVFGRTNNPWDLGRTPGGSTGGGAAAVAAGLTPLEFGSDIGGSIRVPAAFCGIYGHKPSETAIPQRGHFAGLPAAGSDASSVMLVLGPLARSAEDLELAFDTVAGPDVPEDVGWRLKVPAARHQRLSDFRVAVLPAIPWLPVDAEIMQALERLATALARAGAQVQESQPEGFGDLRHHHRVYCSLLTVMTSAGRPEADRRRLASNMRERGDEFDRATARGLEASAADYMAWMGEREAYRRSYRDFFRRWDVLLAPITIVPAFPHTDVPWPARRLEVNGQSVAYGLQTVYPAISTLGGQPATAFPVGLTHAGLPIGLQAIGPYLEDRTPIRFAGLIAQELGGFRPPTGYDTD